LHFSCLYIIVVLLWVTHLGFSSPLLYCFAFLCHTVLIVNELRSHSVHAAFMAAFTPTHTGMAGNLFDPVIRYKQVGIALITRAKSITDMHKPVFRLTATRRHCTVSQIGHFG